MFVPEAVPFAYAPCKTPTEDSAISARLACLTCLAIVIADLQEVIHTLARKTSVPSRALARRALAIAQPLLDDSAIAHERSRTGRECGRVRPADRAEFVGSRGARRAVGTTHLQLSRALEFLAVEGIADVGAGTHRRVGDVRHVLRYGIGDDHVGGRLLADVARSDRPDDFVARYDLADWHEALDLLALLHDLALGLAAGLQLDAGLVGGQSIYMGARREQRQNQRGNRFLPVHRPFSCTRQLMVTANSIVCGPEAPLRSPRVTRTWGAGAETKVPASASALSESAAPLSSSEPAT